MKPDNDLSMPSQTMYICLFSLINIGTYISVIYRLLLNVWVCDFADKNVFANSNDLEVEEICCPSNITIQQSHISNIIYIILCLFTRELHVAEYAYKFQIYFWRACENLHTVYIYIYK